MTSLHHVDGVDELTTASRLLSRFGLSARVPAGHASGTLPAVFLRLDCAYTLAHWSDALARRWARWEVISGCENSCDGPENAVAWIDEYESLDWAAVLSPPYRIASSYCVRKGLGRKAAMAPLLESHVARCGSECALAGGSLPRSIVIDTYSAIHSRPRWLDFASALSEALSEADDAFAETPVGGRRLWILKPSMTNKGAGIAIVKDAMELRAALAEAEDAGTFVMQEYLSRPLLLDPSGRGGTGHKFHIRLYVLAVGALEVWVFREALVLFAPRPYNAEATDDLAAHLTNSCLGSTSPDWRDDIHVRALSELPSLCGAEGGVALAARIYRQMARAIAHAFVAMEGNVAAFLPAPACFEMYGVDFLVDDAGRAILLEFNPSPDVRQTGSRLDSVIGGMIQGAASLALGEPRVRPSPQSSDNGGGPPPGSLRVAPPGGACAVDIDLLPRVPLGGVDATGVALRAGDGWEPGSAGVVFDGLSHDARRTAATARESEAAGWECVYAKIARSAQNMNVAVR